MSLENNYSQYTYPQTQESNDSPSLRYIPICAHRHIFLFPKSLPPFLHSYLQGTGTGDASGRLRIRGGEALYLPMGIPCVWNPLQCCALGTETESEEVVCDQFHYLCVKLQHLQSKVPIKPPQHHIYFQLYVFSQENNYEPLD